jgi:hypothetical protein
MENNRHIWLKWINQLHRWGLSGAVKTLLNQMGGLGVLLAQGLYFVQPMVKSSHFEDTWGALALLLEDEGTQAAFIRFLEEQEGLYP